MGIIQNRTKINGQTIEMLVAHEAVGKRAEKYTSFETKFDKERTR